MIYLAYGFLLVLAGVIGSTSAWLRLRRMRAGIVVQRLAGFVSHNLPLARIVRATAEDEHGAIRRIFTRLAEKLERGEPLSIAVRAAVPSCPGEVIGALQGAERGGTLPGVLQALAARVRRRTWARLSAPAPTWYPVILLVLLPVVVGFFVVLIIPKFKEIFEDFGTKLPALTTTLVTAAQIANDHIVWLFMLGLGLIILLIQASIGRYFFTRLPDRWQPLYATWDTLVWALPGLRATAQHHALAEQLPLIHTALRAGHDLGEAATQGTFAAVNWHARRRLRRWAAALTDGQEAAAAARQAGLPSPVVRALLTARSDGEIAARFEYLADYYQSLYLHWRHILTAALTPLMVVAWAVPLAYVVVALVLPLVSLIQSVMNTIY
jgi:type IV pilus assembly protein PilC